MLQFCKIEIEVDNVKQIGVQFGLQFLHTEVHGHLYEYLYYSVSERYEKL